MDARAVQRPWRVWRTRVIAAVAALGLTASLVLAGHFLHLAPVDDGYITFRCARNLADGHGLVYNAGERVESTTNFFYAVLLAMAHRVAGVDFELGALAFNAAGLCVVFFLLVSSLLAAEQVERAWRLRIWGLLFLWVNAPVLFFLFSGMETVCYSAALFAGFVLTLRSLERGASPLPAGLALGLAAIIRLEAVAYAGLAVAAVWLAKSRADRWRAAGWFAVGWGVAFLPVLIYRWQYYGTPLPISYYVKVDGGSRWMALRGALYASSFLLAVPLAAVALASAIGASWRHGTGRVSSRLAAAWLGLLLIYTVFVGGDYFPLYRFLVPALPVAAWIVIDRAPRWSDGLVRSRIVPAPWIVVAFAVFFALTAILAACSAVPGTRCGGWTGSRLQHVRARNWQEIGLVLHDRLPPDTSLFVTAAGAMPYFSGLRTYDNLGLTDPVVARERVTLGKGLAGHEKRDCSRVFIHQPDVVFVGAQLLDTDLPGRFERYLSKKRGLRDRLGSPERFAVDRRDRRRDFDEITDLFDSVTIMRHYELSKLMYGPNAAYFLVKKSARPEVHEAFLPMEY
jgi:hypothetical protein